MRNPLPNPAGFRWLIGAFAALSGLCCERVDKAPPVGKTPSGAEMVCLPGGWVEMGSNRGKENERPAHRVWVDPFWIDRYEVTQELYGRYVLANPSHFKGPRRPVEQVSWAKAALYCNLRSKAEGLKPSYDEETAECDFQADGYRLPTEAEWEYACRGGTDTDYSFGRDPLRLKDYAWCAENSSKTTHPVGQKKPNPWGLYDMHGNVAEWCSDVYDAGYYKSSPDTNPRGPGDGERYVLRSGAWNSTADGCRSSCRVGESPGFQDACFARDAIGFRCVRNAPPEVAQLSKLCGHRLQTCATDTSVSHPHAASTSRENPSQGRPSEDPVNMTPTPTELPRSGQEPPRSGQEPPRKQRPTRTGFVYDEIYLRHKTTPGHPERPERLLAIVKRLEEKDLLSKLVRVKPLRAGPEWITAIHTPQYVEQVRKACREGARCLDAGDTPISADSYEAAVQAAGGVLAAVDAVMEGTVANAFCAVRPPGHHALKDRAMGFCIFNNVAIAARYAQKKHKLPKILIVDWDVHHGNGTQAAFYDDPTVVHFDVHRHPFYPGTGRADDTGSGKGVNSKINVPLPAGSTDQDYVKAFETKLTPAALAFQPDFVLVSAGFDACKDDPLGGMKLTAEGYARLTRIVKEIAAKCCKGRMVCVLEGGYDPVGLADCVEAHIRVLME